ncbi:MULTISPECIES: hypothetical protein [Thermoanaerobacterium]|uniref:hypothetical protein n=1 Tax=Thermoanaerobacterium TaxID=28895 RepID=UPI00123BCBCD|nr:MULTISPECIES: hypothetical protein [Thermoanaerobacterium]KAA5806391.1 hypothetical protein F1655_09365 [Thermoanaerobacterium thermosaccharolyticum]MDE4541347.1 hypothetical protein [Thermoanaerobacterium sp. R66]
MNNFAEELAYWYLRFNGFLLLQNFVLHNLGNGNQRGSADSDLLAIRFLDVYEKVGGQDQDWDKEKFYDWGIDIDKFNLAFITEVKSSKDLRKCCLQKSFLFKRLESALYRFGIFPKKEVSSIAKKLYNEKYITINSWIIAKLAVTEKQIDGPWIILTLSEIDEFIQKRIKSYQKDKYADRIYFPSSLLQYLTWKYGHFSIGDF